jgi:hypothetical protein
MRMPRLVARRWRRCANHIERPTKMAMPASTSRTKMPAK